MARNKWLAVDAATSPGSHARQLRREWEQFVTGGQPVGVRPPVADSWERSMAAGVDPSGRSLAPVVADGDEASARWEVHPLAEAAPLVRDCMATIADESEHLIVVSDAEGVLLWVEGNAHVRTFAADSMNFTEGTLWSEGGAGTNAIGTALAADHAVQIFATEHYNKAVQPWACSAAPVHDPDTGELLGVIDLTGRFKAAHPHSLGLAIATARAVESGLRWRLQERSNRLRSRYADRLSAGAGRQALVTSTGRVVADYPEGWLGGTRLVFPPGGGAVVLPSGAHGFAEPVGHEEAFIVRAVKGSNGVRTARPRPLLKLCLLDRDRAGVEVDGCPVELSRRHTEILALLCTHRAGMSSEALAADLYGDAGQPGTVRVEVFRLRKLLGPSIEADPYRLSMDVESDVRRVQGLLDRGAVREAVDRYDGPLLPRSEAPGVVREREALDSWLRQAVMTADDDEALWAWVQSSAGEGDMAAWKRLLAHLEFRDPRRSLAASRLNSLRTAYAANVEVPASRR